MANVKISELTAASAVATTDELEINAAGTSKKATLQKLVDLFVSIASTFTAAQTFRAANAVRSEAAAAQDAVVVAGRAGGTSSYAVTVTPTTLSGNRTLTLPDATGTVLTTAAAVAVAQGGTGQTSYTDGQLLIGNTTGNTLAKATLTAGSGITVTNAAGAITIAAAAPDPSPITNSLSGNVSVVSGGTFYTGPSVGQGSTGKWFASATLTLSNPGDQTATRTDYIVKLWDGTTVIASTKIDSISSGNGAILLPQYVSVSLSGYINAPAGNIRVSVASASGGTMLYNATGEAKDCTLTAIRVG